MFAFLFLLAISCLIYFIKHLIVSPTSPMRSTPSSSDNRDSGITLDKNAVVVDFRSKKVSMVDSGKERFESTVFFSDGFEYYSYRQKVICTGSYTGRNEYSARRTRTTYYKYYVDEELAKEIIEEAISVHSSIAPR